MSGGRALADASWSGCTDGLSLRINHRKDGAISVREADRGVFGVSTLGGLKRKSATTGPYHEAREFDIALLAGGSGPSYSAQRSRMAQQVCPFDDEARKENRQGGDGAETGYRSLLDVAQGMGLRAVKKVRFARGPARTSRWCEVEHLVIDWAARSSLGRSSK